jgi:hypothetical protein
MTTIEQLISGDHPGPAAGAGPQSVAAPPSRGGAAPTHADTDPWAEFTPAPPRGTAPPADGADPWAEFTPVKPMGAVEDAARSLPSGAVKGTSALVGLPDTIGDLWHSGADYALDFISRKLGLPPEWVAQTKDAIAKGRNVSVMKGLPSTQDIQQGAETAANAVGLGDVLAHKPQTPAGRYAETVGEFIPGAVAGPVSGARQLAANVIKYAAVPGIASEAAGQATEGTGWEPLARAGAAVVTGGGMSMLGRPRTAEQVLQREMPAGMDRVVLDQAESLIADAQRRGIALTWPEAIEQVSTGSGQSMLNMQRLLESSRDTRGQMGEFFAQRPGQIDNAARAEFGSIAPVNPNPSSIGYEVGRAASGEVRDVRGTINAAAKPYYDAAAYARPTALQFAQVQMLPGYAVARNAVRSNPQLNRYVAHLPDRSVGFLNEVKKQLDQQRINVGRSTNPNQDQQIAAGLERDARAVRNAGVRASQDYGMALAIESYGRDQILAPLLRSPLGQLAKRDLTTKRAFEALFPANPNAGSAPEISQAVGAISRRSPRTAASLVRTYAETVFNEATQSLKAGAPQGGGAKFAATIAGNPQQRANLQAAVEALPNGRQTWQGFERFLEIASATGKRQDIGSRTAFNAADLKDMGNGKVVTEMMKSSVAMQRLLTGLGDAWDRWQLGNNLGHLARILTDPQSGRLLRAIAQRPSGSQAAWVLAARMVGMVQVADEHSTGKTDNAK